MSHRVPCSVHRFDYADWTLAEKLGRYWLPNTRFKFLACRVYQRYRKVGLVSTWNRRVDTIGYRLVTREPLSVPAEGQGGEALEVWKFYKLEYF